MVETAGKPVIGRGLRRAGIAVVVFVLAGALTGSIVLLVGRRPASTSTPAAIATATSAARTGAPSPVVTASTIATPVPPAPVVGYEFRPVSGPAPVMIARVANGYIGECAGSGHAAVCTSSDAVKWSLTPDPAIFRVSGSQPFAGWSVAHSGNAWVAAGTIDPGFWRSVDGVAWTPINLGVAGLQRARVQPMGAGFVMVADVFDGKTATSAVLVSSDGQSWNRIDLPEGLSAPRLAGAAGIVALRVPPSDGSGGDPASFVTSDGANWKQVSIPTDAMTYTDTTIADSVALPNGGFVGMTRIYANRTGRLLISADGVSWQMSNSAFSAVYSITSDGKRVIAATWPDDDHGSSALWESTDGIDWSEVAPLEGHPAIGAGVVDLGGSLVISYGGRLSLVATRVENAASSPEPSATPTTPASASTSPAAASSPKRPADGLSKTEAIRIARSVIHPGTAELKTMVATPLYDGDFTRWVWLVSSTTWYGGNIGATGHNVTLDYQTGDILNSGTWIS